MHKAHSCQAEDVGDFVRVGEDCSCAMRNDGFGKSCWSQQSRFDMHMAVAQPWHGVLTACIDDFSRVPDAMACILAAIGEATAGHRQVMALKNLLGCAH